MFGNIIVVRKYRIYVCGRCITLLQGTRRLVYIQLAPIYLLAAQTLYDSENLVADSKIFFSWFLITVYYLLYTRLFAPKKYTDFANFFLVY